MFIIWYIQWAQKTSLALEMSLELILHFDQ